MMLSTAQALKEWDSKVKLLAEVKAYAAAHPNQNSMPSNLRSQLVRTSLALARDLASAVATWKQMLKNKVSTSLVPHGTDFVAPPQ
jgi:hypothetical protein